MKTIQELFSEAFHRRLERGYSNLYIAIDLHGTIINSTQQTKFEWQDGGDNPSESIYSIGVQKEEPYIFAFMTLKLITEKFPFIKLILWTSAKSDKINAFVDEVLKKEGIKFSYVNENPDFFGNLYADFSKKFCFDILIDDKAGFDPQTDWFHIYNFLKEMPSYRIQSEAVEDQDESKN